MFRAFIFHPGITCLTRSAVFKRELESEGTEQITNEENSSGRNKFQIQSPTNAQITKVQSLLPILFPLFKLFHFAKLHIYNIFKNILQPQNPGNTIPYIFNPGPKFCVSLLFLVRYPLQVYRSPR